MGRFVGYCLPVIEGQMKFFKKLFKKKILKAPKYIWFNTGKEWIKYVRIYG